MLTPTNLMKVTEHVSSSLCPFLEGSDGDNNSQRVLWAEGTACAKALRWGWAECVGGRVGAQGSQRGVNGKRVGVTEG